MSGHTEASLKALTVPKLKELLAAASLSQTGKKDELISRLLDAAPSTSTGPEAVDAPVEPATTEPAPAPKPVVAGEAAAPAAVEEDKAKKDEVPVPVEPTPEEKAARAKEEEEKRVARAARFGVPVVGEESEEAIAKKKRAEKYGTGSTKDESAVDKSLAALDRPLGSSKPERKPRAAADAAVPATAKTAPAAAKTAPAAKTVDPELAKRLAEEEEKKKKRAARFGPPAGEPADKKTKIEA